MKELSTENKIIGKSVAWLMAVPISECEYRYAEAEGPDRLEDLFEQQQIDIFDINRPPVRA